MYFGHERGRQGVELADQMRGIYHVLQATCLAKSGAHGGENYLGITRSIDEMA